MKIRVGDLELEWIGDSLKAEVNREGKGIGIEMPLPEGTRQAVIDVVSKVSFIIEAIKRDLEDGR